MEILNHAWVKFLNCSCLGPSPNTNWILVEKT